MMHHWCIAPSLAESGFEQEQFPDLFPPLIFFSRAMSSSAAFLLVSLKHISLSFSALNSSTLFFKSLIATLSPLTNFSSSSISFCISHPVFSTDKLGILCPPHSALLLHNEFSLISIASCTSLLRGLLCFFKTLNLKGGGSFHKGI